MQGGYEFEPASGQIAKEFQCIICQYLLRDTVSLPCGHGYCSACLDQWERERSERFLELQCSTCKAVYKKEESQRNKMIDRYITTSMDVKCRYHGDGCEWIGNIVDYQNHKEHACEYTKVLCTNEGCEELVRKCYLENHLSSECFYRLIECQACHTMQEYHNLERHFLQCPCYQTKCPTEGCEEVVERNQITNHLEKDCRFYNISCEYAIVGCKEKFLRQDKEDHMNVNMNYHLSLVLKNSLVEIARSKRQLKEATDRVAATEDELRESQATERTLKLEVEALASKCAQLDKSFNEAKKEIQTLKCQLGATCSTTESLKEKQDVLQVSQIRDMKNSQESIEVLATYLVDKENEDKEDDKQRGIQDWCHLLHKNNYQEYRRKQIQRSEYGYNLPKLNQIRDLVANEETTPENYDERFRILYDQMDELEIYPGCLENKILLKVPVDGHNVGIGLLDEWMLKQRKRNVHVKYTANHVCIHSFSSGSNVFIQHPGWGHKNVEVHVQHPLKDEEIKENIWHNTREWSWSGHIQDEWLIDKKYLLVVLTKKN